MFFCVLCVCVCVYICVCMCVYVCVCVCVCVCVMSVCVFVCADGENKEASYEVGMIWIMAKIHQHIYLHSNSAPSEPTSKLG